MTDRFINYQVNKEKIPTMQRLWPLYGVGFENLGKNEAPIEVEVPEISHDELLVRHDAVGLCFSDIKVIKQGQDHPRIYKDMQKDPVVLGHEVSLTVVKVGENLLEQYEPGDRFIIQADVFVDGVGYAYGYELQGGLSQYSKLDQRVLNGDDGNYLIPVKPNTGYAESALTEPWACVTAAYELKYRTGLKSGGETWIIGSNAGMDQDYTISSGFTENEHPSKVLLSNVPQKFEKYIRSIASKLGVEIIDVPDIYKPLIEMIDDIVILGADADLVESVSPFLADFGVIAIVTDKKFTRPVNIDVGRIHYNRWLYVGGTSPDIAKAYSSIPVRSALKTEGRALFIGAGGPMGHMHVQRALQVEDHPATIVCTDVSENRLNDICASFFEETKEKKIEWKCLNPLKEDEYSTELSVVQKSGFDDIVVLAPIPAVISEAATHLGPNGVMNIFAGVNRGVMAEIDLNTIVFQGARIIGHSASSIDDLRFMLKQAEAGKLSPNRSVSAVGSLSAARDGLIALRDIVYPGKVVIFPQIMEFPLTSLDELKEKLPTVWHKLKNGHEWTIESEKEFLRIMLPEKKE